MHRSMDFQNFSHNLTYYLTPVTIVVSNRYRIGKVSDTFFEYRGKYRKKIESIGIVSGKKIKISIPFRYF